MKSFVRISRYIGLVLLLNSLFMVLAVFITFMDHNRGYQAILFSAIITALFGLIPVIFFPRKHNLTTNDGFIILVLSWILSCFFGMLPYALYGGEFTIANAWFESTSGYTTTGASILTNIEALPAGLLFWRAATHWIGGMGIILFALSLLPSMGFSGMLLYKAEMSELAQESFEYSSHRTIKILLQIYLGLTILETILLKIFGMPFFDAITHAFATVATGGFSIKNTSVAYYNSASIELIIIIFMVLSGINFGQLYTTFIERKRFFWQSTIVRVYLSVMTGAIVLVMIDLHGDVYSDWGPALRSAAFQVVSIGTTTGFASADSAAWPNLSQLLLIYLALQCACAGSTSGGIKLDRIVLLIKSLFRQIRTIQHPRAVIPVRVDGELVGNDLINTSVHYVAAYLLLVFVTTVILVLLGMDNLSAFSGTVAAAGNVGPGFGSVGSMGNFSGVPLLGKYLLAAIMLIGRLEIFGLLIFIRVVSLKVRQKSTSSL